MTEDVKLLTFEYTNYRGERSKRRVRPLRVHHAALPEYYDAEAHWFLRAFDVDRGAERDFMLSRISGAGEEVWVR